MTDPRGMLPWGSLGVATVLITFRFYFFLFTFYVCPVNKTFKSFDGKKKPAASLELSYFESQCGYTCIIE